MQMRTRKALGCFALLAYMLAYIAAAAALGAFLLPMLPDWGELVFYAFAGVAWVAPLKPLFGWMNRGG